MKLLQLNYENGAHMGMETESPKQKNWTKSPGKLADPFVVPIEDQLVKEGGLRGLVLDSLKGTK